MSDQAKEDQKPKVDGKRPARRPFRIPKKEFETKVVGLEKHTFDIGHAKYAAKFIALAMKSYSTCKRSKSRGR